MIFYGATDVGKKRAANQDNFIIKEYSPDILLGVVCDGMGGARGGGCASSLAAEAFTEYVNSFSEYLTEDYDSAGSDEKICDILRLGVDAANKRVYGAAVESDELSGMGTTLVASLITPRAIYVVNVGDSRMYYITGGTAKQITRDHSYVQYLVDIGKITPKAARRSDKRNIITRAVGTQEIVEADLYTVPRADGEAFVLLCTDGLHTLTEPKEMADALKHKGKADGEVLKRGANKLIELANGRGGSDNITAVILSY